MSWNLFVYTRIIRGQLCISKRAVSMPLVPTLDSVVRTCWPAPRFSPIWSHFSSWLVVAQCSKGNAKSGSSTCKVSPSHFFWLFVSRVLANAFVLLLGLSFVPTRDSALLDADVFAVTFEQKFVRLCSSPFWESVFILIPWTDGH